MPSCKKCNDSGLESFKSVNNHDELTTFYGPCDCFYGQILKKLELMDHINFDKVAQCESMEDLQCLIKQQFQTSQRYPFTEIIHKMPETLQ